MTRQNILDLIAVLTCIAIIVGIVWLATFAVGCVAAQPHNEIASSQPVDVQQLTGQVVAAMRAQLSVEAKGVEYTSQFGIGAVAVVGTALVLVLTAMVMQTLLSHRREMARIAKPK